MLESSATDTVISGTTAGRLHGLWLPELQDIIHVATASPGRRGREMTRTKRTEFIAHRYQLRTADVTVRAGLPMTSPARTWRDLAGVLDLPGHVAAGDSVLRGGTTLDELHEIVRRTSRGRYSRRAKYALTLLDARSRSRPESHLRVAISAPGMPRFQVNAAVYRDDEGWLAEPDLSLPEAKLALEYQGADHAELRRMRRDITRGADMRRQGWLTLLYGPSEVFGRPWEIRPEVRALIADRAPGLLRHGGV